MNRSWVVITLAVTFMSGAACARRRPAPPARFVPPEPHPAPLDPGVLVETAAHPPEVAAQSASLPEFPPPEFPGPPPPRRRRVVSSGVKPESSQESAEEEAKAAPQLGVFLTAQQREELAARFEQHWRNTDNALAAVAHRRLSSHQQAVVQRVEEIRKQAVAARESDPTTACSLIERADLLLRDLVTRVR